MIKVSNRDYIIPIKGMSIGKHSFDFTIDNSFFEEYENRDILGADLNISLNIERSTLLIEVKALIDGVVRTECDRCLDELEQRLETEAKLIVKFVKTVQEEDNEEVLTLDPNESELNLKQFLYDYICLALPIQRVHNEGDCNPDMIRKLGAYSRSPVPEEDSGSPFGKLKNLLN
ncbi:MAG: DUF177 domain-containing protein [Bacteroidales bacterium]|nr:DUF177 domain-containing protein [Bacteroidales bacterium]